ncbi:MAG: hypothetical protein IPM38_02300 [Ignavibacteria bacterium]|nr:hypothetical protein [Ignavibacteria bacterium]
MTASFTSKLSAQENKLLFNKEITVNNYKIIITNNNLDFFTGSIKINDNTDKTVFFIENLFSRYVSDTLADLNRDGSDEFILNLATGVNAYDFNMLLVFDFSLSANPLYEIHNAEIAGDSDEIPRIVSHVRFSPLYLGTGYDYSLLYDGEKMVLDKETGKGSVLSNLDIIEADMLYNINEFKKEMDECDETSNYISYFEQYLMQKKILNKEAEGLSFFDKYYECSDKDSARTQLKNNVKNIYEHLSEMNHRYIEE